MLALARTLISGTLVFSAPSGCAYSSTSVTDLTAACSPALIAGGCLLFDAICQRRKAQNTAVLSEALASAPAGSTLRVPPGTYHLNAGVYAPLVNGTTLQLEGTLNFGGAKLQSHRSVRDHWPNFNQSHRSRACNCFTIKQFVDFRIVSPPGSRGIVDGGGRSWYGYSAIAQIGVAHVDQGLSGPKPAMINFGRATDAADPGRSRGLVLENVWFRDSGCPAPATPPPRPAHPHPSTPIHPTTIITSTTTCGASSPRAGTGRSLCAATTCASAAAT